jgi:hypothetical protein
LLNTQFVSSHSFYILFNDFKEKESAIGKEEDVSSYRIEAGAQLNYAANMSYVSGLEMLKKCFKRCWNL